jgi:hypothetical protein
VHLQDELIISVLRFVPPHDVLRLALVCRRWRRITGDPFVRARAVRR